MSDFTMVANVDLLWLAKASNYLCCSTDPQMSGSSGANSFSYYSIFIERISNSFYFFPLLHLHLDA